jgi:uncharacterized protein YprB with RNaseH-like and TPR domain
MLKRTFVHIPGIGAKSEERMWQSGIASIDQLLDKTSGALDTGKPTRRKKNLHPVAHASVQALKERDFRFFYTHLPANQHWRLLGEGLKTAYLDIETTGLDVYSSHITSICVYDGCNWNAYIYGRNLDAFREDIRQYELLVTYNGKTFDIPFVNHFFKINLDTPHVDLRYPLAAKGYKGGLKKIEQTLGLGRTGAMKDVDGFMAVHLWNEYATRKNPRALETLIAYNLEDVFNLAPMAARVFNLCLPENFKQLQLPETYTRPEIPYAVDEHLVMKLKSWL